MLLNKLSAVFWPLVPRAPSGLLTEQCSYAMCVCVSTPGRLVVYWVSNTELTSCQGLNVWSASRTMWPAFREREKETGEGGDVGVYEAPVPPSSLFFFSRCGQGWSVSELCVCHVTDPSDSTFLLELFVRSAAWHHLTLLIASLTCGVLVLRRRQAHFM